MKILKNIIKTINSLPRKFKIIGIIILIAILFIATRSGKNGKTLEFASVKRGNISSQVSASGILNGKKSASLKFPISGKLTYLGVENGTSIKAGQVIAAINSIELNAIYQQALNNRRNTQANVDNIYDQLKNNASTETFAQRSTRTAAEVANDNAYDAVLSARQALNDTILFSPISGVVVTQDNISVGQNISSANTIALVVDFSEKDFDATVDESDIGKIKEGMDANVTLNAYGDTVFSGKVIKIEPQTQTDSTGAITVTVKIKVDDPRITQIYGLNGNANIITSSKENVIIIPQDALIDDTHVWIKTSKKAEKREIKTGIKSDTEVEVISGLNEGDTVVTNPQAVK